MLLVFGSVYTGTDVVYAEGEEETADDETTKEELASAVLTEKQNAKVIGSAYALIFWIQNIGLWLFPLLIGKVLDKTNPGVTDPTQFDYTAPLVMLAVLGVLALVLGLVLKVVDKKKGIGLEEPNIKE